MLGASAAASALFVSVLSPFAGKLGDHVNSAVLMRVSYVCMIVSMVLLLCAQGLFLVFTSFAFLSFSLTLFWPIIQAAVGKESKKNEESKDIAEFSVCWSIGKSAGFLVSGYCLSGLGLSASTTITLVLSGVMLLAYPYVTPEVAVENAKHEEEQRRLVDAADPSESVAGDVALETAGSTPSGDEHDANREDSYIHDLFVRYKNDLNLPIAWIFNFTVYGIANTVASLYIKVIMAYDIEIPGVVNADSFLGVWNFFFYLSQTICFVVGARHVSFWEYNRILLYVIEAIQIVCLALLATVHQPHIVLLLGLCMGTGTGLSEISSLTYSLRASESDKGKYAGINETIINAGNFIFPLILGFVSDRNLAIPYALLALIVAIGIGVQELLYRLRMKSVRRKHFEVPYESLAGELGEESNDVASMSLEELGRELARMSDLKSRTTKLSVSV